MLRSVILALGVFVLLFGIQCLCVKTFVFTFPNPHVQMETEPAAEGAAQATKDAQDAEPFTFTPSRTVAWSLVAVGGFLVLNVLTGGRKGG